MPAIERANRHQYIVLWEAAGSVINEYGRRSVYEPEELRVRWELVNRQGMNALNEIVAIDGVVFCVPDIAVGSLVWLGKMADLPSPVTNLLEVVGFENTPDIKGRIFQKDALLKRRNDLEPDVVGTGSA